VLGVEKRRLVKKTDPVNGWAMTGEAILGRTRGADEFFLLRNTASPRRRFTTWKGTVSLKMGLRLNIGAVVLHQGGEPSPSELSLFKGCKSTSGPRLRAGSPRKKKTEIVSIHLLNRSRGRLARGGGPRVGLGSEQLSCVLLCKNVVQKETLPPGS